MRKDLTMFYNLPPILDGYELVPDEETKERRRSDVGCKVLRPLSNKWMDPKAVAGRFKYHPSQRYIRPIKPVATSPSTEPPLGLCPRNIWLSGRVKSIKEAMARYACAKKDIPYAWVEELFDLETDMSFGKEQP